MRIHLTRVQRDCGAASDTPRLSLIGCHPDRSEGPASGRSKEKQVLRFAQDDNSRKEKEDDSFKKFTATLPSPLTTPASIRHNL